MTMARRPSTAESVPVTANKPDHIIISLALYASASRRATNRSWRLPRRNHASNRSGRRWRGCRSLETVSRTTAGNSKSVNRPRGSARSQLQLPSRRPNHQKRPHPASLDSRHAPYRTNHEQNVKGASAAPRQAGGPTPRRFQARFGRLVRPGGAQHWHLLGSRKSMARWARARRVTPGCALRVVSGPLLSQAAPQSKSASRFRGRASAPDRRQGFC
jgi:hypothetical protein